MHSQTLNFCLTLFAQYIISPPVDSCRMLRERRELIQILVKKFPFLLEY